MLLLNFADPKSEVFYTNHQQDHQLTSKAWYKKSFLSLSADIPGGLWKW